MDVAGVAQRATDALAGLLQGRIGEADDREAGQTGCDVHLDADEPAVEAVECCGWDDGQHAPQATRARSPPGQPRLTPRLPEPHGRARHRQRTETVAAAVTGLSTVRAKWSSDEPSAESALVNMTGAPEFRALIAPRYSFTI